MGAGVTPLKWLFSTPAPNHLPAAFSLLSMATSIAPSSDSAITCADKCPGYIVIFQI